MGAQGLLGALQCPWELGAALGGAGDLSAVEMTVEVLGDSFRGMGRTCSRLQLPGLLVEC